MKLCDVCWGTDAEEGEDDKLRLQQKYSCWLKFTNIEWLGLNDPC